MSFLLTKPPIPRPTLLLPGLLFSSSLGPLSSTAFTLAVRRGMAHRAFQLRLDPLTGNSEWVVVEDREEVEDDVGYGLTDKAMLATTSYLDMLNDRCRNRAYNEAIRKTITKPCRVLDIGSGTGLLSMMAARALAECGGGDGVLTACESYLPMGKLTRKVLRANGMEKKIKVIHKRSDELQVGVDIDSRADVLVSEILDSELLGEGLIPTLQHAHEKLLIENPQTVPFRATIYGQLVESTFLWKMHDLYSSEVEAPDGIHLVPTGLETIISVKPKQHAMQCTMIGKETKLLSDPFKVFDFEFSRRPESHGNNELHIRATDNGTVHAIISWWVLQLDNAGSVYYSTAPLWLSSFSGRETSKCTAGLRDWCDHWKQCVWFIPRQGIPVCKDNHVICEANHDVTSISFHLRNESESYKHSLCSFDVGPTQIMLLPEKIGIYGDKQWRTALLAATRKALRVNQSPFCLLVDDSLFLALALASLSKRSHILSIFPGLQQNASLYLASVANANGFSKGRVEVLKKRASFLTADDLHGRKIDLLIGEPFYYGNEGALPWQNLRFWKERTILNDFLSKDVVIMPCKGILKACALSLPDLWKSRRYLNSIEGFDHSDVNEILGACGDLPPSLEGPCLPFCIKQCGEVKVLSNVASMMEFDFSNPIHPCSGKIKIAFNNPGVCHGFALWIDWVMDKEESVIISTGPANGYWKQGVKLLSTPVVVNLPASCCKDECGWSEIEASFDPSTGKFDFKSHFSYENYV